MDLLSSQFAAEVGTLKCPYKLCLIGGGPSGCSVLIRAVRIGVCDELCDFVYATPSSSSKNDAEAHKVPVLAGVCIIDKGPPERFGGGRLSDYQINSNTWANKFVTNITDDKLDVTPQETVKNTVLGRLKTMPNAIEVESYGTKNVPLCTVGALLCDAGRMICNQMYKFRASSAVLTDTTAESIYRVQTKTFVGWRVVISRRNTRGMEVVSDVYCKNLVLCTGGVQRLPVLPTATHNHKLLSSDYVCTNEGINEVKRRIMHHYLSVGPAAFNSGNAKVAIVGGSHSAFSAAWMCLNKISFPECVVNPKSFVLNTAALAFASSPMNNKENNKSFKLIHSARRSAPTTAAASDESEDPSASAATTVPGSPTEFSRTVGGGGSLADSASCSRRTSFSVSVAGSEDRESMILHGTISPKQPSRKFKLEFDAATNGGAGGGGSGGVDCEEIVNAMASPTKSVSPHQIVTDLPNILNELFHSPTSAVGAASKHIQQQQQSHHQALRSPSPQKAPPNGSSGFLSPHRAVSASSPSTARKEAPSNGPSFQRNSIVMLHRSPIEVFYATKAEADADNYQVDPSEIGKVTGQIHPFGGLRGDAKELWRAVKKNCTESRLKLVQVKGISGSGNVGTSAGETTNSKFGVQPGGHTIKNSLSDKIMDDAVVIIWACGYNTNSIPVYDTNGGEIPLRIFRGQVEVDDKGNVLTEDGYQFSTELTKTREVVGSSNRGSGGEAAAEPVAADVGASTNETASGAGAAAVDAGTAILMEGAVLANGSTKEASKDTKDPKKATTLATAGGGGGGGGAGGGKVIPNLMGNGLGYGFKATLENGQLDGSSGRADGVAVYLKRGATLILAKVLGNKVYGGDGNFKSWEERNQAIRKQNNLNARASLEEKEKMIAATNKTMNDIIASVNSLSNGTNGTAAGGQSKVVASAPPTPSKRTAITTSAAGFAAPSSTSEKAKTTSTPVTSGGSGKNNSNQASTGSSDKPRLNSAPSSNNNGASAALSKSMPLPLNLEQSVSRLSQPRVIDTSNTLYTSGDMQRAKAAAAAALNNKATPRSKGIPVKRNNFVEQQQQGATQTNSGPSPALKNRLVTATSNSTSGGDGGGNLPFINQKGETPPNSSGSMTGSLLSDSDVSGSEVHSASTDGGRSGGPVLTQLPGKQVKLSLPQIKSAMNNTVSSNMSSSQMAITVYSPDKKKTGNLSGRKNGSSNGVSGGGAKD